MVLWRKNHPDYYKTYFRKNKKIYNSVKEHEYYLKIKDIKLAKKKLWIENNKEKHREMLRIYRHNRRAGGKLNLKDWVAKCELMGNKCQICNKTNAEAKLTIDHIIPVSLGGTNEISNLQPLCLSCNSRKGKKEWYNKNAEL